MHEEALRTHLQRRLAGRFTEGLWSYLREQGFVEDAILVGGDRGHEDLEREARRILEAAARPTERGEGEASRPEGPTPGQERAWAVSQLVAVRAHKDPEVVTFRREYLGDRLVEWSKFETWVRTQVDGDAVETLDLTCAIEAERLVDDGNGGWVISPPLARIPRGEVSIRYLSYVVPENTWVRRVRIAADSALDKLRVLAETLARAYAWTPAQAATFVVTGVTPQVSVIRVTGLGIKFRRGVSHAWARRFVFNIDPAVSPQEVLRAYKEARRKEGLSRLRPVDAKKSRLAAFAGVEHADKTWAERWQLWNRKFPEWTYSQQSNFRRDALKAQNRLLYPGE